MEQQNYPIPAVINEWAEHEERTTGCRPSEASLEIAALVYDISCQVETRGQQDRSSGRNPLPFSSFEAVSRSIIACTNTNAVKLANVVAELLHQKYMAGYSLRSDPLLR